MIDPTAIRENYSGVVTMEFRVGGQVLPLSGVGPDHIEFREPVELPPCEGEVVMTVDGREEHVWRVRLDRGATGDPAVPVNDELVVRN